MWYSKVVCYCPQLRTYTPFFAKSLVSLIPDMLKDPPTFDLEVS